MVELGVSMTTRAHDFKGGLTPLKHWLTCLFFQPRPTAFSFFAPSRNASLTFATAEVMEKLRTQSTSTVY